MVVTIINTVFCFLLHDFLRFYFVVVVCFLTQSLIFSLQLVGRYGGKWLPWWLRW